MSERDESQRGKRPDRAERLAAALRANLKRRKAQARGRAGQDTAADSGKASPNQSETERGED
jgi:hypothetical protein